MINADLHAGYLLAIEVVLKLAKHCAIRGLVDEDLRIVANCNVNLVKLVKLYETQSSFMGLV